MDALRFFIKTVVLTALLVLFLQIRWNEKKLEDHAMKFLNESSLIAPLDETAQGIVKFVRNSWNGVMESVDSGVSNAFKSESRPGQRQMKFNMERSKEYLAERAVEAQQAAKEGYDTAREQIREKARSFRTHLKEEGVIDESQL